MDVADERDVQQRLALDPEVLAAFALALCIGDEGVHELEDVLFAVNIGEGIVVHGLAEVDGVEHPNLIPCRHQQLAALHDE